MSDPETSFHLGQIVTWAIGGVLTMVLSLFGYRYKKTMDQVSDHEKNHVSRDEVAKGYQAMADSLVNCDNRNQKQHADILERMEAGQKETRDSIGELNQMFVTHLEKNDDS